MAGATGEQILKAAESAVRAHQRHHDPGEVSDDYKMDIDFHDATAASDAEMEAFDRDADANDDFDWAAWSRELSDAERAASDAEREAFSKDETMIETPRTSPRVAAGLRKEEQAENQAQNQAEPQVWDKMQAQRHGVLGPDGELAMTEAEAIEKIRPKVYRWTETDPKNIKVQETSADPPLEDLKALAHRSENLRCINCQNLTQNTFLVIPSLEGLTTKSVKGRTGQFFARVYGTCPLCAWREDKKNHLPSCECEFCKKNISHYEAEVCEHGCRVLPMTDSFWKKHKKSAECHWTLRRSALRQKGVARLRTRILLLSPNLPTSPLSPPPPYPFTPHL
jgi:hypothetical protein